MIGQINSIDPKILRPYVIELLIAGLIFLAACGPSGGGADLHVQFHGSTDQTSQSVTINADNVTLRQLFGELATQARIAVTLPKEMESELVSISVKTVPLEKALRKLLSGRSYTISYESPSVNTKNPRQIVVGVQVFDEHQRITTKPAPGKGKEKPFADSVKPGGFGAFTASMGPDGGPTIGQTPIFLPAEPPGEDLPFEELKQSFRDAKDAATRVGLLETLADRQDEGPITPILATAFSDSDENVRQAALEAMKSTFEPVDLTALMSMASNEKRPDLLIDVTTIMADTITAGTGSGDDRAALLSLLTKNSMDPNPDVQEHAMSLLEELSQSGSQSPIPSPFGLPR
jgi:hypothetical protein